MRDKIILDSIKCKKLIPWCEYFHFESNSILLYCGKIRRDSVFIIVNGHLSNLNEGFNYNFLSNYNHKLPEIIKERVKNYSTVKYKFIINWRISRECFIPLSINNQSLSKPLFSDLIFNVLIAIKNNYTKDTVIHQIANTLINKLPLDYCELNNIGYVFPVAVQNDVCVFTINKERVDKTLSRMTGNEISVLRKEKILNSCIQTKPGRIFKQILGKMFPDDQLGNFVNIFTSKLLDKTSYKLSVVSGPDIAYWYDECRYSTELVGTLQNSCLRNREHNKYQWNFYAKHKNCQMAILVQDDKLLGRALVWKTIDDTYFLDRIYYTHSYEEDIIRQYVMDNFKIKSTHKDFKNITSPPIVVKNEFTVSDFKENEEIHTPYLDSFKYYTRNLNYLVCSNISFNNLNVHYNDFKHDDNFRILSMFGYSDWTRGNSLKESTSEWTSIDGKRYLDANKYIYPLMEVDDTITYKLGEIDDTVKLRKIKLPNFSYFHYFYATDNDYLTIMDTIEGNNKQLNKTKKSNEEEIELPF